MRILIIEDEFNLADVIASRLKKEKYAVDIICDGEKGFYSSMTNIYDLIILNEQFDIRFIRYGKIRK